MNTSKGSITPARFQDVNRLALSRVEGVLAHWLPGGVIKNGEYIVFCQPQHRPVVRLCHR